MRWLLRKLTRWLHPAVREPRYGVLVHRPWDPPYLPGREPGVRRKPKHSEPLPGEASALVRPYVIAHEQRVRRRELALAALGQDMPGPMWIHGVEVPA
jgi:hypothetical protein